MIEFSIGQRVVCVGEFKDPRKNKEEYPVRGKAYTIRGVVESGGLIGVLLEEIVNPIFQYRDGLNEAAFGIRNFRPMGHPLAVNAEILHRFPIIQERLDANMKKKSLKQ